MTEPQGYPKRVRLCAKKDIDRVFREGQYRKLGVLHVKFLATERAESRFLVSVKKKLGNAPARNRIKRRVREAIRLNRRMLRGAWDVCLFLTAKPPQSCGLNTYQDEIRRLFADLDRLPPSEGRCACEGSPLG